MFSLRKRNTSAHPSRQAYTPSLPSPACAVPLTSCEEHVGVTRPSCQHMMHSAHTTGNVASNNETTLPPPPPPPSSQLFKLAPLHILPPPAFVYAGAVDRALGGVARKTQLAAAIASAMSATTGGVGNGGSGCGNDKGDTLGHASSSRAIAHNAASSLPFATTTVGARELIDAVFAVTSSMTTRHATSSSLTSAQSPLQALVGSTSVDRDVDNPRNIGMPMPMPTDSAEASTGTRHVYLGRQLPPVMIIAEQRHRCIAIALHSSVSPATRSQRVSATAGASTTDTTAARTAKVLLPPSHTNAAICAGGQTEMRGGDAHCAHAGNKGSAGNGSSRGSSTTTAAASHSNGISDSADVAPPPPPPLSSSPSSSAAARTTTQAVDVGAADDGEHLYFGTVLGYTYDNTALVWHNRSQRFASRVPVTSIARVYRVVVARCRHCGLVFLRAEVTTHMHTHLKGGGVVAGIIMDDSVIGIACGDTALLRTLVYDRPLGEGAQGVVDLFVVNSAARSADAPISSLTTRHAGASPLPPQPPSATAATSTATASAATSATQPHAGPCRVRQQVLLAANSARGGGASDSEHRSSSNSDGSSVDNVPAAIATANGTRATLLVVKSSPSSLSQHHHEQRPSQRQRQRRDTACVNLVPNARTALADSAATTTGTLGSVAEESAATSVAAATRSARGGGGGGDDNIVVVKTMRFDSSDVAREGYYRAVRFMTSTSHPCLVEYMAVQLMPDQRTVRIVMPYYSEGDLTSYVRSYRGDRLSEVFVCTVALQLAQALACLHTRSPPLVHGDVKMENVMLCSNASRVVLMDLDASCEMRDNDSTVATVAGTTAYMAPESLRRARVMPASDMWSLGVVLYVLVMLPEFPMIIDPDTMQPILLNADAWATEADVQVLQDLSSAARETDKSTRTHDKRSVSGADNTGVSAAQRAPRHVCSMPLDECVRINIGRRGYSAGLTQLIVDLLRFSPPRRPTAAQAEQRLRALLTQQQQLRLAKQELH